MTDRPLGVNRDTGAQPHTDGLTGVRGNFSVRALRPERWTEPVDMMLSYRTWGTLNEAGTNCVLLPTYYTGRSEDCYDGWIGPQALFDPDVWFVVVPDMFGNGRSTAPSNSSLPSELFSQMTIDDNVRAQRALLSTLGVHRVAIAAGWSMGGMQALAWASAYPDEVGSVLAVCATARCWPVNQAFLAGLEPYLTMLGEQGREAFGRAYAGWAYSAQFLREEHYRELGVSSLDQLLTRWADDHREWSAADLLAMLRTWRNAGRGPDLGRIECPVVLAPSTTDAYFTVDECVIEAERIARGSLEVIESVWGHIAGRPGLRPEVTEQLTLTVRDLIGDFPDG